MNIILKSLPIFSIVYISISPCDTTNIAEQDNHNELGHQSNYKPTLYDNYDKQNNKKDIDYNALTKAGTDVNTETISGNDSNKSIQSISNNNINTNSKKQGDEIINSINNNRYESNQSINGNNINTNNKKENKISNQITNNNKPDNKILSSKNNNISDNYINNRVSTDASSDENNDNNSNAIKDEMNNEGSNNNISEKASDNKNNDNNKNNNSKYFCNALKEEQYTIVTNFVDKMFQKCNGLTLDTNSNMKDVQNIFNSITSLTRTLIHDYNRINQEISNSQIINELFEKCEQIKKSSISMIFYYNAYSKTNTIISNMHTINEAINNIYKLYYELLNPIFFSRILAIGREIPKKYEYTLNFIEENQQCYDELLSIYNNQISSEQNYIMNIINKMKIENVFNYYIEQYKSYIETLNSKFKNDTETQDTESFLLIIDNELNKLLYEINTLKHNIEHSIPKEIEQYISNSNNHNKTIGDYLKNV